MSIPNDKYFDIKLNNDKTFYIVESSKKSELKGSAISTLQKIESVLQNQYKYSTEKNDHYSHCSDAMLKKSLWAKSVEIQTGYQKKRSKSNIFWRIFKKIFGRNKDLKEIAAINAKIRSLAASNTMPLHPNLMENILSFLPISKNLPAVNKAFKSHADNTVLLKAKEWGYQGFNVEEAINFTKELFQELRNARNPYEDFFVISMGNINEEKSLKNFKNFTTEEIFNIFKDPKLINDSKKILTYLLKIQENWQILNAIDQTDDIKNAGSKALFLASSKGDEKIVELLLKHEADPNIIGDLVGHTPLHTACESGHTKIIKLLLDNKVDPNIADNELNYPLHYAAKSGNLDSVKLLLEKNAQIDSANKDHDYPIHLAIKSGNVDVVKLLLDHGANVDSPQRFGLITAFCSPNAEIIDLFLDNETSPSRLEIFNFSLLILKKITQKGLEANLEKFLKIAKENNKMLDQDELDGGLARACGFMKQHERSQYVANPRVVELLLEHGANPNEPAIFGGKSYPLDFAAQAGEAEIVKLLINAKSFSKDSKNVHSLDTALLFTCGYGAPAYHKYNIEVIKLLLEMGANPNYSHVATYPLALAKKNNLSEAITLLLDHGARGIF